MSDDQENNFYLSLYKLLISTHLDFKNKLEDYDVHEKSKQMKMIYYKYLREKY